MNPEISKQIHLPADLIGDSAAYLQEYMECMIALFKRHPDHHRTAAARDARKSSIPNPSSKNQTAASSFNRQCCRMACAPRLPPHIATGTRVVIATEDGSYVERAKD